MRVWWEGEGRISLFPLLLCFVMFCVCSVCLQDQRMTQSYFHNRRAWENTNIGLLKRHSPVYYALTCFTFQSWKSYHMSYLTPSSRLPFGFCTLGLSFSLQKMIALLCTPFIFFYTCPPPLYLTLHIYCTFISVSHIFSSCSSYDAVIHLKLSL